MSSMNTYELLLLTRILGYCLMVESFASEECHFMQYLSQCHVMVGGAHNVSVLMSVNECHIPIDVTIILRLPNKKLWSHTFANKDEVIDLGPSFLRHTTLNMLINHDRMNSSLVVQGYFIVGGIAQSSFVNCTLTVEDEGKQCDVKVKGSGDMTGLIALIVFLVLLVFTVILAGAFLCVKRSSHSLERSVLFTADPPSQPYQEEQADHVITNNYLDPHESLFPKPGTASANGSFSKYMRKHKGRKEPAIRRSVELCFGDDETPFTDL